MMIWCGDEKGWDANVSGLCSISGMPATKKENTRISGLRNKTLLALETLCLRDTVNIEAPFEVLKLRHWPKDCLENI